MSVADVKMEKKDVVILVLVQPSKTSNFSSTSFQLEKTFWRVVGAAEVEQSRRKIGYSGRRDVLPGS